MSTNAYSVYELNSLKGRDLLSLYDLSRQDIDMIFKTAETLKTMQKMGAEYKPLKGKTLGLVFEKSQQGHEFLLK